MYNPSTWYWLADDGRVFSGARQVIVGVTDSAYVAWTGAGNKPTLWPRDSASNQTNASLQAVLTPYNLFVDLTAYSAYARYNKSSGGVIVTSLSPVKFISDNSAINDINGAYDYALANGAAIFKWKLSDGSFITLNKTQITTLHNDVMAYLQSCYTCESTVLTGINGGTIKTHADINAQFAAISNTFP